MFTEKPPTPTRLFKSSSPAPLRERVRVRVLPRPTRKLFAASTAMLAWITTSASSAFAHGGMAGPDELGRPLGAAAAIAFICYWAVILWPERKSSRPSQRARKKSPARRARAAGGSHANGARASLKAIGRGSDG